MRRTYFFGWLVVSAIVAAICVGSSALPGFAQDRSLLRIQDPLGQTVTPFSNSNVSDLKPFTTLEVTSGNPENIKPGDVVTLSITLLLPPKSYTYSTNPSFNGRTKIQITHSEGLEAIDEKFETNKPPKIVNEPLLSPKPVKEFYVEKFYDDVVWSKQFRVKEDADLKRISVSGTMKYQVCDDRRCQRLNEIFQASLTPVTQAKEPKLSEISKKPPKKFPSQLEIIPTDAGGKPQPVKFLFRLAPENAKPGEKVTLSITTKLEESWHIYATTHDPKMLGKPTRIAVEAINGLKPIDKDFIPSKKAETFSPPELEKIVQKVHHHEITWTKSFTVLDSASAEGFGISGQLRFMVCSDVACLLPTTVPFALGAVKEGDVPAAVSDNLENGSSTDLVPPESSPEESKDKKTAKGVWPYLFLCFGVGLAAVLTPCFYPMIPITVGFFLKQGEEQRARPLLLASVYSLTIVVSFTVAGLILGETLNSIGSGPVQNLIIGLLLVVFGMSLVGLFDIPIPQRLVQWSSKGEQKNQGSLLGVMFMALTLLIVGTPCIAPFWGPVLAGANDVAGLHLGTVNLALTAGALSFALALGLPFFVLALAPGLVGNLPKSGGWMNTVKMVMGFLLLGLSFKFLVSADQGWEFGLFSRTMLLCIWTALALVTGLYLLGLLHSNHDAPSHGVSSGRMLLGTLFLAGALYLGTGVLGPLNPQLEAMLPLESGGGAGFASKGEALSWEETTFEAALAQARVQNRPVFLDFTGQYCTNCKVIEASVFSQPDVQSRLENTVRAKLYIDRDTPQDNENYRVLRERFDEIGVPFYAVVSPDGEILGRLSPQGTNIQEQFVQFLDQALARDVR